MKHEDVRQTALSSWAKKTKAGFRSNKGAEHVTPVKPSRFNIEVLLSDGSILLFNSRTRSLARLNLSETKLWRRWSDEKELAESKDLILAQTFISEGFLIPHKTKELQLVQNAQNANRMRSDSLMLTIAPTMACNLACGYCFQGLNKDLGKYDKRLPDAIYDFVNSQSQVLNGLSVTWYGGEPLMAKNEIYNLSDRLISLSDRMGISYTSTIVTNGYFLTVDVAQKLWSRRVTSAQVTIDGLEKTHDKMRPLTSGRGSFKMIMKNILNVLDETPLGISLRVNVGRQNVEECDELLTELESRKFNDGKKFSLYFAPIDAATAESGTAFEEGLERKDFNKAVVELGERGRSLGLIPPVEAPKAVMGMCVAAVDKGYVITHKGDVHKCWETAHDPRKRIGTIFEPDKLQDSINAKLWSAWTPFDNPICRSCKILPMCGGFCAHRFVYAGNGDDQALPCPEWKWNTAEYIFSRAKSMGVVTEGDWVEGQETADAMQSGARHTMDSLLRSQARLLDKVNEAESMTIDTSYLMEGDGRFFEGEAVPNLKSETSSKAHG